MGKAKEEQSNQSGYHAKVSISIPDKQQEFLIQVERDEADRRHNIRNAVAIVMSETYMMEKPSPEIKRAMTTIIQAAEHILTIIERPLASIELAKDGENLQIEPVEIIELLEHIKAIFGTTRIYIKKGADTPTIIEADRPKIQQLLYNIIENAIRYAQQPNQPIMINIADINFNLVIQIRDFGIGFEDPPEHLFQRYKRGSNTENTEGTGLGLSYCQRVCTYHKGSITAHNNKDSAGATFTITLPYKQSQKT